MAEPVSDIDAAVSRLGRMLTHLQISAGHGQPLPLVLTHARLVHKTSGELVQLLEKADPGPVVQGNPSLDDRQAALLQESFSGELPATLPDEWMED